jgi:uncharacterized protein YdhG (YjbR/CyaY superfamily)
MIKNELAPKTVSEYIALFPEKEQVILENIRQIIKETAPEAEEGLGYGMPSFKYKGPLVYYAAFKKHCSFFPGNSTLIRSLDEELAAYKTSKGTIQFTADNPLPDALIKKIVLLRMQENEEKEINKKKK